MKKKMSYIIVTAAIGVTAFFVGNAHGTEGKIELEKAIPIEDVAVSYISEDDYPVFELKDVGNQLDDKGNRSYSDIMDEVNQELYEWME